MKPFWVTQYKLLGSRMTALQEECSCLQDQLDNALCKNEELPDHLVERLNFLCGVSLDSYGYSYKGDSK